jgi:hypothetical protein
VVQRCCVCGLPAEGAVVCDCVCWHCGEHVFDDVTLLDHGGLCYDCHKARLLGLWTDEEDGEAC